MVPLLVLCLLSPLLVASADTSTAALMCIQGYDATQAPEACPSGYDACVAIKDDNKLTDPNANATTFYTCQKKDDCSRAFTITIGDNVYLRHTSACCTTADCNAHLKWGVPPASSTKNGLVCPIGCFGETEETCKGKQVSCTDAEDTCFNATVTMPNSNDTTTNFIMHGCGTSNVCELKGKSVTINGTDFPVVNATCVSAFKSSSTNHILGKSSFLLLLPSISSILFMKFLS